MDPPPSAKARTTLIARVRDLLLRPKEEWEMIAVEPVTVGRNYVIYLGAVPVLCTLIGSLIFGYSVGGRTYQFRVPARQPAPCAQRGLHLTNPSPELAPLWQV